jgi:hypothetical protein
MACKTITETIDGIEYATTQFPARDALKLMTRLAKQIGPVFDGDFKALLSNLDDKTIQLIVDVLAQTSRDNSIIDTIKFDEFFTGEYIHLLNVVAWVVDANSFFGKNAIGNLMKQMKSSVASNLPQMNSNGTDLSSIGKKRRRKLQDLTE